MKTSPGTETRTESRRQIALFHLWVAICFILICLQDHSFGQKSDIKFDRITSESTIRVKGLSQNSIYSILQDEKGFIWIGTWDGLNKYDGYSFIIYNQESGLSQTTINALLEDDQHNIWIGTDDGLNMLDRKTGEIRQYHSHPNHPNNISDDFINHLYQCSDGLIWISTSFGLNCYDPKLDIFKVYNFFERNRDSSRTNFITRVREDSQGFLWIGTRNGIHRYNPGEQSFESFKLGNINNKENFRLSNFVYTLVMDAQDNIYAATRQGVFVLNPNKGVVRNFRQKGLENGVLSSDIVYDIFIDDRELVWIGTADGLDVYDPSNDSFRYYKSGSSNTSLSNNDIKCIFQDKSGTIWIGTYNGLNKADQYQSRFTHYFNDPANPHSVSNNIIYSILEDEKGIVWLGTFGGVNLFDREKDFFSAIRYDPSTNRGLGEDKIRCVALDSNGVIWAGTETQGLVSIRRDNLRITSYRHEPGNPNSISDNEIFSLAVSRKGDLFIGTGSGLDIMDTRTGRVTRRLNKDPGSSPRLSDNVVWCMEEDSRGNTWLGTGNGLNMLDPGFSISAVYQHDRSNSNTIGGNWIFSVYEDHDGIIWIGTMGGGLSRLDPTSGMIVNYTENDGLPNNVVYSTLEDGDGNLWISTNRGLSRFNKQTLTFVNYDTKDGIQGNEFNAGAYFRNSKGEMYFGGMNGFNLFYPRDIALNRVPPKVVLTRISILNEVIDTDLEGGEVFELSHRDKVFSIEFSALDYTNPAKNLYRYKLENYDEDWVFSSSDQRKAEYRKVDPGTYRFLVNGSNNDGVWNEEATSIVLIISPPWWQTWFFRLSLFISVISLLWLIIYLRTKSIRKKHEVEKKMLDIEKQVFELEQRALQLQMNPHFIFNSLNAIQNFVISNDTDKAVNYLSKFSHLMRMILANSTTPMISLKDELKSLSYYIDLERLRFDYKFDYEIIMNPSIDEGFILIPPMLLQPYVENSIIHGFNNSLKPGILKIFLRINTPGYLQCIIEDNGIGREKANEIRMKSGINRQPRGMLITQERLDILKKQSRRDFSVKITDLKDEKGEAAGTRVEFNIQYQEL